MSTIFKIDFDFTRADQTAILKKLQERNYKLLGYKGAAGPSQAKDVVPTWFAEDCIDMFGAVEIDYEPKYKVYVFNEHPLAANTIIQMQSSSLEIGLGTSITFNADGTFTDVSTAQDGVITVFNNRPGDTPDVTIGLAALVNGVYKPFCAFTSTSQSSVSMEPKETVCLFVAQTDMVSGSVAGNLTSPGCSFPLDANHIQYDLQLVSGTNAIEAIPGATPVTSVTSGAALIDLLNK